MNYVALAAMSGTLALAGCGSSDSKHAEAKACVEPQNPYSSGTGHYAGFEWAEQHSGASCNGSSSSFNEGCEEYEQQEAEFDQCQAKKKAR